MGMFLYVCHDRAAVGDLVTVARDRLASVGGSENEKKVREATSNENWGTSNTALRDIARATFD